MAGPKLIFIESKLVRTGFIEPKFTKVPETAGRGVREVAFTDYATTRRLVSAGVGFYFQVS